jgi:hypothetical protein
MVKYLMYRRNGEKVDRNAKLMTMMITFEVKPPPFYLTVNIDCSRS